MIWLGSSSRAFEQDGLKGRDLPSLVAEIKEVAVLSRTSLRLCCCRLIYAQHVTVQCIEPSLFIGRARSPLPVLNPGP